MSFKFQLLRILLFAFILSLLPNAFLAASSCTEPPLISYQVKEAIRRSQLGYTEGFVYHSGYLYESSGGYGHSTLLKIDPETGEVIPLFDLPTSFFGEGLDFWKGVFLQLTWKENQALYWGENPVSPLPSKDYSWQNWGLTHDANFWIASDGTSTLRFLNPQGLTEHHSITVNRGSQPQSELNELEFIDGKVLANVFLTYEIVQIDPKTGCIDGILDLSPLRGFLSEEEAVRIDQDTNSIPNGIAYDPDEDLLYVTGKNWPLIFSITLQ